MTRPETPTSTRPAPRGLCITQVGGAGDGQFDNAPAFEKAFAELTSHGTAAVHLPDGDFGVSRPVHLPNHVSLILSPATRLFALPWFQGRAVVIKGFAPTPRKPGEPEDWTLHGFSGQIAGGIIDGNRQPIFGIITTWARRLVIRDLEVFNCLAGGLRLAEQGWYEHTLRGVRVQIDFDVPCLPGAVGVEIVNGSDNHVSQLLCIGYDIGLRSASGSSCYSQVHVWKGRFRPFSVGIHAGGWNDCYSQCQVDEIADGVGIVVDAPFQRFESCMVQGGGGWLKRDPAHPRPVALRILPRGTHGTYLGMFFNASESDPFSPAIEGTLEGATFLGTTYNPHAGNGAVSRIPSGTGGLSYLPVTEFDGCAIRLPAPCDRVPQPHEGSQGELRWTHENGQAVLHLRTKEGWKTARFT